MTDPKSALRAYIALARGPGTMRQAAEGEFDEDLPEDVELEPETTSSQELLALDEHDAALVGRAKAEVEAEDISVGAPSHMFLRVLEELASYVAPQKARRALAQSLASAGVVPDEATSLDIRAAVADALPRLLGDMFSRDDLDLVLERLDHALTDAIVPTKLPSRQHPEDETR